MTIADAIIMLNKKEDKINNWLFVPFDQHDICCTALEMAGKKVNTYNKDYKLNKGRYSDCSRVSYALSKDSRFEVCYVNHGTLRKGYKYLK